VFAVDPAALRALLPALGPTYGKEPDPAGLLAVEVLQLGDGRHALFISNPDEVATQAEARCLLAYCNDVALCDSFRAIGVPMIEAELTMGGQQLKLVANHYPKGSGRSSMVWQPLLTIDGLDFDRPDTRHRSADIAYQQYRTRPDVWRPGFQIVGRTLAWMARRRLAALDPAPLSITFHDALCPDLNSLFAGPAGVPRKPATLYGGQLIGGLAALPGAGPGGQNPRSRSPTVMLHNPGTVGAPDYRFEAMEVLGFRINVPPGAEGAEDLFAELVRPLNFHLEAAAKDPTLGAADFEYRAATRSIIIELIRYGRMKYRNGTPVLPADCYMTQHELLARVLVGRVDEDGAQAREPATFVQSIFVDNPTSKAVGRDMQGYPKALATFCIGDAGGVPVPVTQNGLDPGGVAVPLHRISTVSLTTRLPEPAPGEHRLLDLSYSIAEFPDERLQKFDAWLWSGLSDLVGLPWRHDDFDDPIFRRAFARRVVQQGLRRSRSVQVVPVDVEANETRTWLTGSYALNDIRFEMPPGIASLTLQRHDGPACTSWNALCTALGATDGHCTVSLPAGHWYRLQCGMDLSINDGLAWE
jgi:hypothetical protein